MKLLTEPETCIFHMYMHKLLPFYFSQKQREGKLLNGSFARKRGGGEGQVEDKKSN